MTSKNRKAKGEKPQQPLKHSTRFSTRSSRAEVTFEVTTPSKFRKKGRSLTVVDDSVITVNLKNPMSFPEIEDFRDQLSPPSPSPSPSASASVSSFSGSSDPSSSALV